ncbi:MAG: hypothetical protein ABL949_03185 [Fimbriimonadaceae bacterium]
MTPEGPGSNFEPPRLICPRCKSPLDGDWCRLCARHRQALILWTLFLILPIFAFGACTAGLLSTIGRRDYNGSFDWLFPFSIAVIVGSPIVGVFYAIFRRKK